VKPVWGGELSLQIWRSCPWSIYHGVFLDCFLLPFGGAPILPAADDLLLPHDNGGASYGSIDGTPAASTNLVIPVKLLRRLCVIV
jgi:hypothetical protein